MIKIIFLLSFIPQLATIVMVEQITERNFSLVNPSTTIKVEQVGPDIHFHFWFAQDFGADKKDTPNNKIGQVVVLDGIGQEIWRIEAPPDYYGSATVTYGIVPRNFIQLTPKQGNPRRLEINENYYVRAQWPAGAASFVYQELLK